MTDARGSYRLAYYSVLLKRMQEYKIRLDTLRKGVRLLAREGFTSGVGGPSANQIETAAFNNQIDSPVDAAEIGLRVALSRPQQPGAVNFDIRVDPADVLIDHSGENYQAKFDVIVAFYSEGKLRAFSRHPNELDLYPSANGSRKQTRDFDSAQPADGQRNSEYAGDCVRSGFTSVGIRDRSREIVASPTSGSPA